MRKSNLIIVLLLVLILGVCLVACGEEDEVSFTVTFDTQGGSEVAPIIIGSGNAITLPENPTKEGYIFDGWYIEKELLNKFVEIQTISDNITLYAKWACDHTPVTDAEVDADCENTGLTEGSHCSKCDEVLVEQQIISAGHQYNWVDEIPATCTDYGEIGHYECQKCGMTFNAEYQPILYTSISKLPHVTGKWTDEIPSTYEHEGVKGHYYCSECENYIDKKGDVISNMTIPIDYVKEYFNMLWDVTSDIGSEEVATNQDLAVSMDFGVTFDTIDLGGSVRQSVSIGMIADMILDRSNSGCSDNTAIKLQLYDMSNGENWITVYYFFNDLKNIYFDFAGQNIKIPFNYESKDGALSVEKFSAILYDQLNKKFESGDLKDNSILDVIAHFTNDFGEGWTLDTLMNGLLRLFNINLKDMLFPEDPTNSPLGMDLTAILGSIGLTKDNMFNANGNLDLKSVLTNDNIEVLLFNASKTKVTSTGAHTEINMKTLGSLLGSFIGDLDEIINSNLGITLDYGINNGTIDGFDIGLTFGSITARVDGEDVSPRVTISINDLTIEKASTNGLKMATDKINYSSEIALDAKVDCSLCGSTIDLSQVNSERVDVLVEKYPNVSTGIRLDGTLEIGVYGKLDIANIINKGQSNTTALKAWISFDNVNIIEMSMVGDRVAIVVNQEAKIDGVNIADAIISLFGDKVYDMMCKSLGNEGARIAEQLFDDDTHFVINSEFKGVVITGNDVARNFNEIINTVIGMICKKDETGDVATVAAEDSTITKVIKTIRKILPYINTEDGLTIDITNKTIGQVVEEIGKIWDRAIGNQNNIINGIIAKDESNILTIMSQIIQLNGCYYDDAEGLLAELFASNALISLDFGEDGISLDVDVDVNRDCGVDLSISLKATELTEIVDLGKDVNEVGNGWYYCEF